MPRITKRLEFDYAHKLVNHTGQCRFLHGHRGVIEVTIDSAKLDELGMVLDFAEVKSKLGGWIKDNWDHNIILHPGDALLSIIKCCVGGVDSYDSKGKLIASLVPKAITGGRDPFIMPAGKNPTAENLAEFFFSVATSLLPAPLRIDQVRFYETPTSWADCFGVSS